MDISLRQKKIYKTRLSLAQAFIQKLKNKKFDAISIKDICYETEVSEATFFNYFPQKIDVLSYVLKVKLFTIYWTIASQRQNLSFTQSIEKTFELIAHEIKQPYAFWEIISIIGTNKMQMNSFPVSSEEFKFIYPECPDTTSIPIKSIQDFLDEMIVDAINTKELSLSLGDNSLRQFLIAILIGVPLSLPTNEFSSLREIYQKQLSLLWKIFKP